MKFGDLRGILQYVPQFRGRTFVVALDGEIVASKNFSNILLDLAVLRSLNVKVVLVHGAAFQIKTLASRRGVELSNSDGTGVTDDATLEVGLDAITRLTSSVMQSLTTLKIRAATANAIIAHPAGIVGGVDQGHTGTIERVDTEALNGFLAQEILPVVPPLAYDASGRTLRVNSDAVALEVGVALKAAKVIYVLKGEPDFGLPTQVARQLPADEAELLRQRVGEQQPMGLRSKLKHAIRACREGVPRVHLINGNRHDAILAELFSNEGIGTMVFADSYRSIRTATEADVEEMILMMRRAVEDEMLVERTKEEIFARLSDYLIIEIDGNVVGCVALHEDPDGSVAEIACLHVKRSHEGLGYGGFLIAEAEKRAAKAGLKAYAVSTQAIGFFEKHGYRRRDDWSFLPESRRERLRSNGRNSIVLTRGGE
ncbi:MAG: amino-acid N-acetyltransferase [Verrucomicrobiae bacterium]|nr:amino-acid N-acetyltransferase [Verrucomicrobiae bacterium]